MAKGGSNKKVANSLVAIGSAAVMAVYAAGYTRTKSAADRFSQSEGQAAERRPPVPAPPRPGSPIAEFNGRTVIATVNPNETVAPAAKAEPVLTAKATAPTAVAEEKATAPEPAAAPAVEAKVEAPTVAAPVAPAPAPAPASAEKINPIAPPWKDGKYEGWGSCRHGDLQATVTIEGGKITDAVISQCLTRYSCDIIDRLPPQVAKRQSPNVDNVSGATQSADAFYYAVYDALLKAK